jgi:hypothetical protein
LYEQHSVVLSSLGFRRNLLIARLGGNAARVQYHRRGGICPTRKVTVTGKFLKRDYWRRDKSLIPARHPRWESSVWLLAGF